MATHFKPGRKTEAKTWDQVLRHTFRTSYAEDSDLHTLMFVAGDQLSLIIQAALKEFVITHNVATNDPDFQNKVFLQSMTHYAQEKSAPTGVEVLAAINRLDVVENLLSAANQNPMASIRTKVLDAMPQRVDVGVQHKVLPETAQAPPSPPRAPAAPVANSAGRSAKKAPVAMDFGPPEDEEIGETANVSKPSMRDKWLRNHQYTQ